MRSRLKCFSGHLAYSYSVLWCVSHAPQCSEKNGRWRTEGGRDEGWGERVDGGGGGRESGGGGASRGRGRGVNG